ncbi:hypothetical protein D3C87_1254060 [compost metagenome]
MNQIRSHLRHYSIIYILWVLALWFFTGGINEPKNWFYSWNKWDALWYEKIWDHGYLVSEPMTAAFPPGYPLFIGALSGLLQSNFHIIALIVNVLAFFVAAILAAEVLATRFPVSRLAIFVFTLSSPTAYFIFSAYSDSLFSMMMWATLFTALLYPNNKRARYIEAGLLFMMPWLRLTGYAMASWLVLRRWTALVIFLSLGAWLCFNWLTGDQVDRFLDVQKLFLMPQGGVWEGLSYSLQYVYPFKLPSASDFDSWLTIHFLPLTYFAALICTGLWLAYRRQWLLAITLASVLLMSHNQSFWRSVIRYDFPLIPMLGVFLLSVSGRLFKHELYRGMFLGTVIGIQFMLQIYFGNYFRFGHWGF